MPAYPGCPGKRPLSDVVVVVVVIKTVSSQKTTIKTRVLLMLVLKYKAVMIVCVWNRESST